jgi:hypothetical protein
MSEQGTSLESLESGEVSNTADAERMAAILRDMNAAEETAHDREPMPSMVPRMPMPPSDPPATEVVSKPSVVKPRRSNFFGTMFDKIKEPLIVACLMFILSLPVFHAAAAKVVPWAFAMGGELSYIGLIVKSIFAGVLFVAVKFGIAFL